LDEAHQPHVATRLRHSASILKESNCPKVPVTVRALRIRNPQ
jgi:hypothetical protein